MCIKTAQREHLIRWQAAAVWFLKTHRPISHSALILGRCCLPLLKSHITQGFSTSSSGTQGSKHNVLYCKYTKITFKRLWHSPTKDLGTPAPHPACLWHPGAPARPLRISMSKISDHRGHGEGQGKGQSTEHTQTAHLHSLQLLSLSSSKGRWAAAAEGSGAAGGTQTSISQMPNSWLPFPSGWTEAATLNWAGISTPAPPAMPWTAHLGCSFSPFTP